MKSMVQVRLASVGENESSLFYIDKNGQRFGYRKTDEVSADGKVKATRIGAPHAEAEETCWFPLLETVWVSTAEVPRYITGRKNTEAIRELPASPRPYTATTFAHQRDTRRRNKKKPVTHPS